MAVVQTLIGNIKGPQGATGPQGEQGVAGNAATITVGTTSTTAYGNPASVTNVGTPNDAILNFVIPQGRTGESVTELDDLTLNTITTATAEYPQIAIGDTGSTIFGKIVKFFQDLVSKKVDTSAVVNNFTTTQAGYVADARTVSTLKDALTTTKLSYPWGYVSKTANVVTIQIINGMATPNDFASVVLPEGYRPSVTNLYPLLYRPYGTSVYDIGFCAVRTDGTIGSFQYTQTYGQTRVSAAGTESIIGTIVYPV